MNTRHAPSPQCRPPRGDRLADDDDRAAVLAVCLHKLMNVRHMRTGRVNHRNAARFTLRIDLRRHAMTADDDRLAGRNLVKRIHAADSCLPEALDFLRIVDQRPQRHAGELFLSTFKRLEHCASHAEAKAGMLSLIVSFIRTCPFPFSS